MPYFPESLTLTNVSADVINAIRNSGSINYRDYIPVVTPDAESIRQVGKIIMDSPNLRNQFAADLLNMVIAVHVSSKSYESPTARLKKGMLEHGETIEDIFVNLIEAELYNPGSSETDVFKRRFPDIKAAYYVINYQVKYPVTISNEQLRAAFYTADGVYNLIEKIYEQLSTSDAYDDFNMVKYILAEHIVKGRIKAIPVSAITSEANTKAFVKVVKATSNKMKFMKDDYNIAHVKTHVEHADQTLLISSDCDAAVDVEVLAAAFNMEKAEFLSKRLLVDSFGSIDAVRLAACAPYLCTNIQYTTDPNGIQHVVSAELANITAAQLAALDDVGAVLIDDDFIQEYDRLLTMEEIRNPSGLYTNAFYHVWRTYATSPFAPAVVFDSTENAGVTGITVTPDNPVATAGSTINFTATVSATGFVDQTVTWSVSGNTDTDTTIDAAGNLHVGANESATSLTVTATSNADSGVTGTATVTIGLGRYAITKSGTYGATAEVPTNAISGEGITAVMNIGSISNVSGLEISLTTGTIYEATITGSGSNHILALNFIMPRHNVRITVNAAT